MARGHGLLTAIAFVAVVSFAGCGSSDPSSEAPPTTPTPTQADIDKARGVQRDLASKAAVRIQAGEDPSGVIGDLRDQLSKEPRLFDVPTILVSESTRSIAFRRLPDGLPFVFFANRHLPATPITAKPIPITPAKTKPTAPLSIVLLDPEASRPKLGPSYATSGADIASLFEALGYAPEGIQHRAAALTLDDYRKVGDRDALYFQGHGDAFAGFGVLASGVGIGGGSAQALIDAGDIKPGAALAEQRILLSMDESELTLTHHFFETLTKVPRIVFLNGFPIGTGGQLWSTFTTRGAEHFLASRAAGWTRDVDYLAFRVFEELLAGHDLRKVAELSSAITLGLLDYAGPGFLFDGCDDACTLDCKEGILLDCFGGEATPTNALCDHLADNTSHVTQTRGGDGSTTTEASEAAKQHAADQARLLSAPPRGTEQPPEQPLPQCTKQLMDNELATIIATYKIYVSKLKGFRGCLDITQDLQLMLISITPPIMCWQGGVAWRMSVLVNGLVCVSNFMHNAFLVAPKTKAFGHESVVLDPYEFWSFSTHTPKQQSLLEFIGDATGGGANYGSTSVTRTVEADRAQKTVDQMANEDDCEDVFDCLKKEFPGLTKSCL